MARPQRNNVDYFPLWKPTKKILFAINDMIDRNKAYKMFRSSCSAFIKKEEIRSIIFKKSNNKCCLCQSRKSLQIDHIMSVYKCFNNALYNYCNTYENLQVLCKKCNTSKTP